MAKIQVLDVQTANRIAAGEVVERPASVAKELLENALDAGATAVTLEIRDGGVSYLRVTDNGSGIAPEDCRVAFERHATSKIRSGDDLSHIGTLGFRGEALPSIASVSKVELTTRTKDAVSGVKLTIEGGRVTDVREAGCPQGTTFVVKDLFFNTPVRRKFLKRSATEAGYVADVVTELALSRPDIAVRFVNNGKPVFQTVGNNDLRSVIFVLHGKEVSSGVLPFESNLGAVRIRGFVGIGNLARGNRNYEFFFVNGRCIRNAQLSAAVENACRERVMIGKYPYCVCDLRVPLEAVDVNVHPNKLEVRFKDDFPIRENLQASVETAFVGSEEILREVEPVALSKPEPKPVQIEMTQPAAAPTFVQSKAVSQPSTDSGYTYSAPARHSVRESETFYPPSPSVPPWEPPASVPPPVRPAYVPEAVVCAPAAPVRVLEPSVPRTEPIGTTAIIIGQLFATYLLVQRDDKLLIIDQHAAHERILYEKFRQEVDEHKRSQPMLVPYLFTTTVGEETILNENLEKLTSMGFEIEPFGDRTFRVTAVPMQLGEPRVKEFFVELLDQMETLASIETKDIRRDDLVQMACKKAIKGGDTLSQQEVNTLLALTADEDMPTCPHGRPIVIPITRHELERKFKRIQ